MTHAIRSEPTALGVRHLPTHLTLTEIGEILFVSRNTVKTHVVSIYRKLDATDRSEAVARARELGRLASET